jgi:hypothetical protein
MEPDLKPFQHAPLHIQLADGHHRHCKSDQCGIYTTDIIIISQHEVHCTCTRPRQMAYQGSVTNPRVPSAPTQWRLWATLTGTQVTVPQVRLVYAAPAVVAVETSVCKGM